MPRGRRRISAKDLQNPSKILNNLLKDYVDGAFDPVPAIERALVVSVDTLGGALETNPPNPRNSVRARVISNSRDSGLLDDELGIFHPLFSHDVLPLNPGEHIYVTYEDVRKVVGVWISRVPEPESVNDLNYTPGSRKYMQNPDNSPSALSVEARIQDTSAPSSFANPPDFVVEKVPSFNARVADRVINGSNNTAIILGRDRTDVANSVPPAPGQGTIDIVAGRVSQDTNLQEDKSRIIVSAGTNPDVNFDLPGDVAAGPSASIVAKSDEIRIVARKGIKIIVEGEGTLLVESAGISLGVNAVDAAVLGDKIVSLLTSFAAAFQGTMGAAGTVPVVASPALLTKIFEFINNLPTALSKKTKIE